MHVAKSVVTINLSGWMEMELCVSGFNWIFLCIYDEITLTSKISQRLHSSCETTSVQYGFLTDYFWNLMPFMLENKLGKR